MKRLSLVFNYIRDLDQPELSLEQEAVADNSLTTDDLTKMLALVRAGVSAKLYRPETCNVSVVDGNILVDLNVFVWPKPFNLNYTFALNYGTAADRVYLQQNREFDFIINGSKKTPLPFTVSTIEYSLTQLPFFDKLGNIVDPPSITFDSRNAITDKEVIGVIRITCVAEGWQHPVQLTFDKDDNSISNFNVTASTTFRDTDENLQTVAERLELPGCVELLLSTCEDDLLTEHKYGSVKDKDEKVPVVYYSDCDGSFLVVRYEKP